MLEKPDLPEKKIEACLQADFGLAPERNEFLPLGADLNTAVYRVTVAETLYFLKLRRGAFDETSVTLPKFLWEQGIPQIIPPLITQAGRLWAELDGYKVMLYPFIPGQNGYAVSLTERQWSDFGAALQRIHAVDLPPDLSNRIRRETYSSEWREMVRSFLKQADEHVFDNPLARQLAAYLQVKRQVLLDLIEYADQLAQVVQIQPLPFVLCHADIHAGNLLITPDQAMYIVDWDDPIFAPKERDLMFIGGAQGFVGATPEMEVALFYRGYGPTQVNPNALAYYRFERIIQDLAVECQQIFLGRGGDEDRAQAFRFLTSNFLPGNTIEMAYRGLGGNSGFATQASRP